MWKLLWIAIGGAVGTLARYETGTALARFSARFPFGTLAVNLIGCFIMGYLQGLFLDRVIKPELRLALLVGFLGGYTTFSSFGWETTAFLHDGQYARAAMNFLANNVIGIGLVLVGYALARARA
jgi:CrcB protein